MTEVTEVIDEIRAVDGVPAVTIEEVGSTARRRRSRRVRAISIAAFLAAIVGIVGAVELVPIPRHASLRVGASRAGTPSPAAATPVLGTYGSAVNHVGLSQYADIYAGAYEHPDGSVTAYVGPGSDSALLASLKSIDPAAIADAPSPGTLPALTVVRVPVSMAELDRQAQALEDARSTLEADGYRIVGTTPIAARGELDVTFHTVPAGVTVASATSRLDSTIAPNLVVTSIDAAYPTFG